MNTDEHGSQLRHEQLTPKIIGAAFAVLNEVGHGFHEKPYENALTVGFLETGLACDQQREFDLEYKGVSVGKFIPDLIIEDAVIVDAKVIEKIGPHERGQMLNCLRITGLKVGLILDFRRARLEWERVVL